MATDVDRLLSGRTRDIRLGIDLRERFTQRIWSSSAKVIRAWMAWMAGLSVVTLLLNVAMIEHADWRPMVVPTLSILAGAVIVLLFWRERRSEVASGFVLLTGMFAILLAVSLVGVRAGDEFYDRHLHVMLLVALTAVIMFAVPLSWTIAIAAMALGLYLFFQLRNPDLSATSAVAGIAYFACGFGATIAARRTMTLLAQKQFLLELQREAHTAELASANERLTHLARNDPLTGIANRRQMTETLATCWSSRDGIDGTAILMCDIDDFKKLNDRLGHAEGDRCLVEVARIIHENLRRDGSQVARYGGEEFLVLLPRIGEQNALLVAERIRRAVESAGLPNPDSAVGPHVTISVGVAILRDEVERVEAEQLQRMADGALYAAKHAGRNQVSMHRNEPACPVEETEEI